ncbi:RNA 2'-phosphotransferase [Nostocoides vanveenii]|uniref:Probable RNA 2'-phosphotransferase n=1 Tax=Nostocoides vanveenii TaxID=330835 RepID=A0ABP4XA96_9MICO
MDDQQMVRLSKRLSRLLRHQPERIGLTLDAGGWVAIDDLLAALNASGTQVTRADLDEVVARNNKRRYAVDPTGTRIRASQGHTIDVDLGLRATPPPAVLWHGTVAAALPGIREHGLIPMRRNHVHLSADEATARVVGARRGRPLVIRVDAASMGTDGHEFFISDNGVWLTEAVPQAYLSLPAGS